MSPCASIVQRTDPERFTALLFAPAARREALFALHAFAHEIARAPRIASEPTLALIRLQWWREVVEGAHRRHEVATPLRAALQDGLFAPPALIAMVEAREAELDPAPAEGEWLEYLHATGGLLAEQTAYALGASHVEGLATLGTGLAATAALRTLPAANGWRAAAGMDEAAHRAVAARLLGAPRRWPEAAMPAALPAIAARAWLRSGRSAPTLGRLAMLAGAVRRRA